MRNSQQVAKSGEEVRSQFGGNPTAALDAALPPKYTIVMNPDHPGPILCKMDTGAGSLNEWSESVPYLTGVTIHRHTDIHTGPTAYTL